MRIGVAGLGRMGAAIAARLLELGHEVAVWNRSPDKAKPLAAAGAKVAPTPRALAGDAELVITILIDGAAVGAVYHGPDGLLSGDVAGKLFVEMSTVRPQSEVDLAAKVKSKGAGFVECPVGGSIGPARQGKLIGLAGGSAEDVARARPVLEQLCRRLEHCGPVGAGSTMKLTINLPLMVYWQALGEALAMARGVGLKPDQLIDLLSDTSGGANALKVRGPGIAKALSGDDSAPAMFELDAGRKDLQTMIAEGQSRGIELPLVERTLACFDEASRQGWGDKDGSLQSVYWAKRPPR